MASGVTPELEAKYNACHKTVSMYLLSSFSSVAILAQAEKKIRTILVDWVSLGGARARTRGLACTARATCAFRDVLYVARLAKPIGGGLAGGLSAGRAHLDDSVCGRQLVS